MKDYSHILSKGYCVLVINLDARNERTFALKPSHAPSPNSMNIFSPEGEANISMEELAKEWEEFKASDIVCIPLQ